MKKEKTRHLGRNGAADAIAVSGSERQRIREATGRAAEEKLRRLVRRMKLNANDAEVLLGMLRQIAWKLAADPSARPA